MTVAAVLVLLFLLVFIMLVLEYISADGTSNGGAKSTEAAGAELVSSEATGSRAD